MASMYRLMLPRRSMMVDCARMMRPAVRRLSIPFAGKLESAYAERDATRS